MLNNATGRQRLEKLKNKWAYWFKRKERKVLRKGSQSEMYLYFFAALCVS
jgi:hypothetical protein